MQRFFKIFLDLSFLNQPYLFLVILNNKTMPKRVVSSAKNCSLYFRTVHQQLMDLSRQHQVCCVKCCISSFFTCCTKRQRSFAPGYAMNILVEICAFFTKADCKRFLTTNWSLHGIVVRHLIRMAPADVSCKLLPHPLSPKFGVLT